MRGKTTISAFGCCAVFGLVGPVSIDHPPQRRFRCALGSHAASTRTTLANGSEREKQQQRRVLYSTVFHSTPLHPTTASLSLSVSLSVCVLEQDIVVRDTDQAKANQSGKTGHTAPQPSTRDEGRKKGKQIPVSNRKTRGFVRVLTHSSPKRRRRRRRLHPLLPHPH